jgi:Ca2+-binding EF-hand superfamily protein
VLPHTIKNPTAAILAVAGVLTACSYLGFGSDRGKERNQTYRMLYSPNGEPLRGGSLGRPSCEKAMGAWFDRADADRNGRVDRNEFVADARRQFAVMDLDHDGTITPAELDKYRAPYMTLPPTGKGKAVRSTDPGPDPVMSADTKLRFVVTLPDFAAYAERRFAELDRNRNGTLERDEALKMCNTE